MAEMAPENEAPGIIKDHKFLPNPEWGADWARCVRCGLAEAAHLECEVHYKIPKGTSYRCPDCVTKDRKKCLHGSRRQEF